MRPPAAPGSHARAARCAVATALALALSGALAPAAAATVAPDSLAVARGWLDAGEYARVEPVARRLLAQARAAPASRDSVAAVLDVLVESLWRQGHATRAETVALAEQALALRDTAAASAGPEAVSALSNLGAIRTQNGELASARRLLGRALEIRARSPGPDSLGFAAALNELASLELRAGDPAAARRGLERVLRIRQRALGRDHPLVAWSISNLAGALEAEGDFVAARRRREDCLAIRVRVLPRDHPDIARALKALANDLYALGDFARAIPMEQRSTAMFERVMGPDSPEVARGLASMSGRLRTTGDLAGARRAALRSLAIRQRTFDPDNPEIASSLLTLGRVLLESGETAAAEDTLRRALAIRSRVFGPDDAVTALVLDELAKVMLVEGRTDSGVAMCARAVRAKRKGLGAGHPDVARTWRVAADAHLLAGDTAAATHAALEAERITREHMVASIQHMPDAQALAYEATRASGLGIAVRLAARPSAPEAERRQVWDALVRSRARVLDELLARGGRARADVGLDEVLARLPAGSELVSIVRCEPEPAPWPRPAQYVAFIARAGSGASAACDLGPAPALDSLVVRWRSAALHGGGGRTAEAGLRALGGRLRQRLWEPLQPALQSAARVLVVLDGALDALDLYALPAAHGGYLVESGVVIDRLSAERELAMGGARGPGSGVLLAVCGGLAANGRGLGALPQAGREVDSIASLWRGLPAVGGASPRRAIVLRDREATVPALRRWASGCEVLHIASHGVFEGEELDPLRITARGVGSVRSVLERSGLVLAAAPGEPAASAGFLSAREVAGLDLRATRCVTLSGCETGRGRVLAREGSIGLQRAFKLAGARVVVTSLWPVEDRASRRWMDAFYRSHWQQGLGSGAAARAASLAGLGARRRLGLSDSPRTWAGFVVNGVDDGGRVSGGGGR